MNVTKLMRTESVTVCVEDGPIVEQWNGGRYRVTSVKIERTWWPIRPDDSSYVYDVDEVRGVTVDNRSVCAPDSIVLYGDDADASVHQVLRVVPMGDLPRWLMPRMIAAECNVSLIEAQAAIDDTER